MVIICKEVLCTKAVPHTDHDLLEDQTNLAKAFLFFHSSILNTSQTVMCYMVCVCAVQGGVVKVGALRVCMCALWHTVPLGHVKAVGAQFADHVDDFVGAQCKLEMRVWVRGFFHRVIVVQHPKRHRVW